MKQAKKRNPFKVTQQMIERSYKDMVFYERLRFLDEIAELRLKIKRELIENILN